MKKVKLTDIAREAGVGTATVERVLNARGNVLPKTVEKVVMAAQRLGYDRHLPEIYRGIVRIEVIMVRPDTPFFSRLHQAFVRIAASLDKSVVVHRTFVDELDPSSVAHHIARPGFPRSALIIVAPDHPAVRARLREQRAAGVPIVHIVSRISGNDAFVGIDNYAAGRTAAYYMAGMIRRPGSIVALCHSNAYEVHRERIRGFSDCLADRLGPDQTFTRVLFGFDEDLRSADLVEQALRDEPHLAGIYNAGGGDRGVASVLVSRRGKDHIMWIGHELTQDSRVWLRSGLMDIVLDQAPEIQARRALDTVLKKVGFIDVDVSAEPVPFLTINAENLWDTLNRPVRDRMPHGAGN